MRGGPRKRSAETPAKPINDIVKPHVFLSYPPAGDDPTPDDYRACSDCDAAPVRGGSGNFREKSRSVKLENAVLTAKKVQRGRRTGAPALIRMTRQAGVRCL
jgi:hypothetical protein